MSDSVSPRRRRDMASYLLATTYIIATTYGFKNSILTFSDGLLSCHKSDYLHPRRAWRANVKGIEFSTAAGGGGGDAKTSNGSRGNITKTRRGRMKFIGEGVLGTLWVVGMLLRCFAAAMWAVCTLKAFWAGEVHTRWKIKYIDRN